MVPLDAGAGAAAAVAAFAGRIRTGGVRGWGVV